MKQEEFKIAMIDYLSGNLSEDKQQGFEQLLKENSDLNKEFAATKAFWNVNEEFPEPSTNMDMNFYAMLKAEEEKSHQISFIEKLQNFFSGRLVKQFAYSFAILTVGFFIGNQLNSNTNQSHETLKVAKAETENVRSQLVLTLLDQPSANKRLQAVNEVNKLNDVTETILKALFSTLNNDENVNVRLSAIEALKKYTHIPLVREGLVKSITYQTSPMVQMELADLMVILQEKKAVKPFKKLIKKEDVNTSAKEKMEESIKSII
ncbi:HEAT repeat domain-containing protein [Polaribacter aquimarinus]|uniref:Anti-sigma factor n=1 Tax=Polaribacter aquimarinus TaxID=2100726 RepID=A0A2U2JAH2_9FLAO|nr:HEAT repeat domain-containing protein [Polaribacter aquimarinus]PWG05330.1 anti-sigma factor [Polaribacter aquimarinus]